MFRKVLLTLIVIFGFYSFSSAQQTKNAHRADWFKEAKFGMFVHFGLYSILGGSYNGHTLPDTSFEHGNSWYAEWIEQRLEIPHQEYKKLVERFNPINFDADKWIRLARDAGMKYFVITAKHHDGFALWDSKVSDYDLGSTPYKGDLLGDLKKACDKYGLKFGFYYSHVEDWNYPGGAKPHWKPQVSVKDFDRYWHEKCIPQIKELIHRYHPDLFWFDTWGDDQEKVLMTPKRRDSLIAMIRKMDSKILINGRISFLDPGENIDFLEMMDNTYPEELLEKPWQTPATMVHSWGWHAKDYHWKTAKQMISNLVSNVSKGGNYLLNVGPKPDGTFPKMAVRRLMEIGGWMAANGEAVYGAHPVAKKVPQNVIFTQKKEEEGQIKLFVNLLQDQPQKLRLPFSYTKIKNCFLLEDNRLIDYKKDKNGQTVLMLPEEVASTKDGVQVIELILSEK